MKDSGKGDEGFLYKRPISISNFIGQSRIVENLKVFIDAAIVRSDSIDHILLCGPPGLGKTTLAHIVANELNSGFRPSIGPLLNKAGDLAAIVSNLQHRDVFFLDEIHRLSRNIEEVLYSAMEDYYLDIVVGEGSSARSIRLDLARFTLIGATTRSALLSAPLRERFGIVFYFEFYSEDEIGRIITNAAESMGIKIDYESALLIAARSRGTPRTAIRFLRRVKDFADVEGSGLINPIIVERTFSSLCIDNIGLSLLDLKYMNILQIYGRPVGIGTIAAALSEDTSNIEDTVESYLIRINFIIKTPAGRALTEPAKQHLANSIFAP